MATMMESGKADAGVGISKPRVLSIPDATIYNGARAFIAICAIFKCCHNAYSIRMGAIENFGTVIHEFDVSLLYN